MRKVTAVIIVLCFVSSTVLAAPAQDKGAELATSGPRKQLGTIVLAGIAGAVLGLSTLSFYGRPQDRLSNIAVGAAIGIIGGAMFSTYKAATDPKDFYGLRETGAAKLWSDLENKKADSAISPKLAYALEF